MIVVDKIRFSARQFQSRFADMAAIGPLREPEGKRYALCMRHPFDTIAAALYVRERDGSILLLHPDTPPDKAVAQAEQAGCMALIYQEWDRIIPLAVQSSDLAADPALCQFSSGTTGEPKLIRRSWNDVRTETEHYNLALQAHSGEQPVILVPVSHSFGLIAGVFAAFERKAEPIIVFDKNPKFAAHIVHTTASSIVYTVPFLIHLLLSVSADLRMHKVITSGSPLTSPLLARLSQQANELWQQYGCSEVGCISLGANPGRVTDVGRPLDHLQVGTSATEADRQGELIVTYRGRPVHTGDAGYFDSDHRLHVVGRIDDMINVSGLKVLPSEVETVIGEHPGVAEVVVHKTAHGVWGEAVKAWIVLAAQFTLTTAELKAWCMLHLPPYKVPTVFHVVRDIPKTPAGKISRKLLQDEELKSG